MEGVDHGPSVVRILPTNGSAAATVLTQPTTSNGNGFGQDVLKIAPSGSPLELWIEEYQPKVQETGVLPAAKLREVASSAEHYLANRGLSVRTIVSLHLVASGAYGRLTELRIGATSNGTRAYSHLKRAVSMQPERLDVATSYGSTLAAITRESLLMRFVISTALGIDLAQEIHLAASLLERWPDDVRAQSLRRDLAPWI